MKDRAKGAAKDVCQVDLAGKTLPQIISQVEALALCYALETAAGNQKEAAKLAGISYPTFREKMKRHGITVQVRAVAAYA